MNCFDLSTHEASFLAIFFEYTTESLIHYYFILLYTKIYEIPRQIVYHFTLQCCLIYLLLISALDP